MQEQTFQNVRQSVANSQGQTRDPKGFYVSTSGYGFNAATTEIIRLEPRKAVR